ncbi:MAG: HAMP domain-containing histidine kinase [Phaeodactylibacter sp.]|nr:HAMP domain-containing histidine kinase [Sinomicrobium sp.]MCB0578301.1 HAMP domain-containing histidine kinase [Phaeodactylibacter sp.]MCB9293287.1 HAMP domain-containing histidine kinase [Lewinellaceae bacterium]
MKLIKRTYFLTALWLLPVMFIGSVFCFYMIEYIAYEETDEFLTYEMERLLDYHKTNGNLPDYHKVSNIIPGLRYDKPVFKDTLLLETGDNEMVPYRMLYFTIHHKGRDFTIVLSHLLLGKDDVAQGTALIIFGLMFLVSAFLVLIVNHVTRKIWAPFYQSLNQLTQFKIGNPLPQFPKTTIEEFETLNATLAALLKKITNDYQHNKEFNENASHELQTHLAVIRSNTEKLLNKIPESTGKASELQTIYSASTRLSQVQRSLLLLSKISNGEYSKDVNVDMRQILFQSLSTFSETIELRGITVKKDFQPCEIYMDAGLAEILINNLVKNAVKHNVQDGFISIKLTASSLETENSGLPIQGDPGRMFRRFAKGNNGNSGIGLAIVDQICELYGFVLSYEVSGTSNHKITIRWR